MDLKHIMLSEGSQEMGQKHKDFINGIIKDIVNEKEMPKIIEN